MRAGKLVLITGGARSGKSAYAQERARASGKAVVFVATAQGLDEEMRERILAHQKSRPACWLTVEEPLDLEGVLASCGRSARRLLLIDCLTLWLGNLLLMQVGSEGERLKSAGAARGAEKYILARAKNVRNIAAGTAAEVIVVTNEVGMGLVPDNKLGRVYRDLAGTVNQLFAASADEVHLLTAGLPRRLK